MSDIINEYSIKDRFRQFYPVIVDVETAGLDPKTDALIEVSMMTVKMDEKGMLVPDEQVHANIRPFPGSLIKQANIDFLGIDPFDESRNLESEEEALKKPKEGDGDILEEWVEEVKEGTEEIYKLPEE